MEATTERDIQIQITRYLSTVPFLRVWNQESGRGIVGDINLITATLTANGIPFRIAHFGVPGMADLGAIARVPCRCGELHGLSTWWEIKTDTGRQSEQQRNFETMIQVHAGHYSVLRSVDDARRSVEELQRLAAPVGICADKAK